MKILVITELSGGGVEKANTCLAKAFMERGHDVKMLSLITPKNIHGDSFDGVPCMYLEKNRIKECAGDLINVLKQVSPDIIHASNLMEVFFSLRYKKKYNKNVKIVYVQHSVYSMLMNASMKTKVVNGLIPKLTRVFSKIDGLICVSNGVKKDLDACMGGYNTKTRVIYNPIMSETNQYRYREIQKNHIRLVTAGRIEEEKMQETMIEAVALLEARGSNCSLTIFGEGSREPMLRQMASQLKVVDSVEFVGFVTDLGQRLGNYDIFLLTSKHESFGNVLVEAMNCGLPVISTDCMVGPGEILSNGQFGTLIQIGDANALADAIEKKVEMHCESDVLAAYERSQQFDVDTPTESYLEFFEELIKG